VRCHHTSYADSSQVCTLTNLIAALLERCLYAHKYTLLYFPALAMYAMNTMESTLCLNFEFSCRWFKRSHGNSSPPPSSVISSTLHNSPMPGSAVLSFYKIMLPPKFSTAGHDIIKNFASIGTSLTIGPRSWLNKKCATWYRSYTSLTMEVVFVSQVKALALIPRG
jgi:hypothetical protein